MGRSPCWRARGEALCMRGGLWGDAGRRRGDEAFGAAGRCAAQAGYKAEHQTEKW